MTANRDPAIKLFGKTIPLKPIGDPPQLSDIGANGCAQKDVQIKATSDSEDRGYDSPNAQEKINPPPKSMSSGSPEEHPSSDKEDDEPAAEEQRDDPSSPKQKTLKKPDKILPCPRCKSMETKFCYYNNYNVNQPRHFCKNCQRYWTAGGSMRNVPVGAGRRKNKNSASHYRHIALSNPSFQAAVRSSVPDLVPYALKPNGTVLSFGSDVPLQGSKTSPLNLAEKNSKSYTRNSFHYQVEDKAAPPCCSAENGDEHSSKPSQGSPISKGAGTNNVSTINKVEDFPSAPCFNGTPLVYSWIPAPALYASSFPVPFYPAAAAYWSCAVPPGTLNVPWVSRPPVSSPIKDCPTRGKRSRDADADTNDTAKNESGGEQDSQEKCIWMPKALRIDDPEEAAKSSVWAMFGAKNRKVDAVSGGGLFKAFHSVEEVKNHAARSSQLLHANPAAISRSLNFQESL